MKRIWVIVAGVLVITAVGLWFYREQNAVRITYREIQVTRSDLEMTIQSTGTVQPENRLEIKPPIAGRVENVLTDEGKRVRKGQILAWMSSTERAALLDAARAKGSDELKKWQDLYRATPILAPINGTIIRRAVEAGQTFTSADAVFVMSDRLTVKAQVDETDIAQISLGQKAILALDAYPSQTVPARVDQIAYDATTVNNVTTYSVDVLPDETPEFMRSGMTANVTFNVASQKNALAVPNQALKVRDGKYFVLIKSARKKEKPEERAIETGLTTAKLTEVKSGLADGDTLLVAEIKTRSTAGPETQSPFSPMRRMPRTGSR